jgi:hypothetical protein
MHLHKKRSYYLLWIPLQHLPEMPVSKTRLQMYKVSPTSLELEIVPRSEISLVTQLIDNFESTKICVVLNHKPKSFHGVGRGSCSKSHQKFSNSSLDSRSIWTVSVKGCVLHLIIIYPTCIDPSICKKCTCKPFQIHAKCPQGIPVRGNEVSDAFNHTRMGVFMKNMLKCTKEISHDLGCRSAVW